jgi:hypothetical protein
MDPDTALNQIRGIIAKADRDGLAPADMIALMDLIEGLDNWLSKGGFLPDEWTAYR